MRYSAGASNNILGPGNGAMANAIAHRIHEPIEVIDGVPRYWTDEHHDPRQHWPLRDRGMKEIPGTAPTDAEIDAINGVIQSQSGMYNNGYLGKQGIPQVAGQFMTPGFNQEIPQISTGPYTGKPGEGFGPIGTYKGGSFAVPLPYYG